MNPQKCSDCEEFNDLLEQSFCCLYGFKKKAARYLKNHSVKNIEYNLEDSIYLYDYFKPAKLPEYDSLKYFSIPSEVCVF